METVHTIARDFRDDCIEAFADADAELREQVAALEAENAALRALAQSRGDDAASYRRLALQAITHARTLDLDLSATKHRYLRLVDEHRALRAALTRGRAAA